MAQCKHCDREMNVAPSCALEVYDDFLDGVARRRIPYGEERWWGEWGVEPSARCNDCGVALSGVHHPKCDQEQCARCSQQALGCECWDTRPTFDGGLGLVQPAA